MKLLVKIGYVTYYAEIDVADTGILFSLISKFKTTTGYPLKISDEVVDISIESYKEECDISSEPHGGY